MTMYDFWSSGNYRQSNIGVSLVFIEIMRIEILLKRRTFVSLYAVF